MGLVFRSFETLKVLDFWPVLDLEMTKMTKIGLKRTKGPGRFQRFRNPACIKKRIPSFNC